MRNHTLRIISGELKGRFISLAGSDVRFRPTQERVRQAVVETVKERVPDSKVADFCAGSGSVGIELISRGAAKAHFIEEDRRRSHRLSTQLQQLGIGDRTQVFCTDIRAFVRHCAFSYDIIFYDPPYDDEELSRLVPEMLPLLTNGGILLYERPSRRGKNSQPPVPCESGACTVETRTYGDTAVDFVTRIITCKQGSFN